MACRSDSAIIDDRGLALHESKKIKGAPKGHERRLEPRRVVNERCGIEVQVGEDVFEGIAVDVSPLGVGVFLSSHLAIGAEVALTVLSTRFEVSIPARVIWCNRLPSTKNIIKQSTPMPWKMGLVFEPKSDEEKKAAKLLSDSL